MGKFSPSKLMAKNPLLIWMSGFLLPFLYLVFAVNLRNLLKIDFNRNKALFFMLLLFAIQLVSISLSFFYSFFSWERFFAHLHNILAFSFVFLGYYLGSDRGFYKILQKSIKTIFFVFGGIIILTSAYYFLTKTTELVFYGVPGIFGIETKFNIVGFYFQEWYLKMNFPRTIVFAVYPNATGILLFLIHYIYIATNYEKIRRSEVFISSIVFVVSVLMTGSRLYLLLSLFICLCLLLKNKTRFILVLGAMPLVMFITYFFVEFLLNQRESSNSARWMIYQGSFEFMIETNPLLGLGMKPRIPEIVNGPYPLGSHSTLFGYFIKCGLIGGVMALSGYILYFSKYAIYLFKLSFSKMDFNKFRFIQLTYFAVILLTSFTEDFDVFETIPFYFGICLFLITKKE